MKIGDTDTTETRTNEMSQTCIENGFGAVCCGCKHTPFSTTPDGMKGEIFNPPGLEFESNGKTMKYCYGDCPQISLRGWLLYKHPDGQWIALRRASDADIKAIMLGEI